MSEKIFEIPSKRSQLNHHKLSLISTPTFANQYIIPKNPINKTKSNLFTNENLHSKTVKYSFATKGHLITSNRFASTSQVDRRNKSSLPAIYGHLNDYDPKTRKMDLYLRVDNRTIRYKDCINSYSELALDLCKRKMIPLKNIETYTQQIQEFLSSKINKIERADNFWVLEHC